MNSRVKLIAVAAVVIAVVASGVGIATAEGGTNSSQGRTRQPAGPAAVPHAVTGEPTGSPATFLPITPCRIVDTRLGGGVVKGRTTRTFQVSGTDGFPGQGGHPGGCGIPAAATSVALSVTTAGATGPGYVTVYPNGAARPTAVAVSFSRGVTITGSTDATLGTSGAVSAYLGSPGSATLVLDVTGYYIGPIWADVRGDGTLLAGSRVAAVTHLTTGEYEVDFDRNISGCAYSATAFDDVASETIVTQPRFNNVNGVYVQLDNPTSPTFVDGQFYVVVTC